MFNRYKKKLVVQSAFAHSHADVTHQFGISIVSVNLSGASVTLHNVKFICKSKKLS